MQERLDWQALRTCDSLVEGAIADGAYQEALDHLVRGYQRAMVSFCRTQLGRAGEGGRAEEVAQEVFLAAYQSLPRFQRTALTGSMGMMRQHAKHNYRGAKVEPKQL